MTDESTDRTSKPPAPRRRGRPREGVMITVRLPESLLDRVGYEALDRGESRAATIRRLLREALDQ